MNNSPLAAHHVYRSQGISEPAFDEAGEALLYARLADGKRAIVRQDLATGLVEPVAVDPAPRGGVGYGGGLFALRGATLAYAATDGRIHVVDLGGGAQRPISPAGDGVAAPAFSPCGRFVVFLCEQDGRCNVLLTEAAGNSLPVKLSRDPWYAFNPTFSPDGSRIAWQEWDEAFMPWQESRIRVASLKKATPGCRRAHQLFPVKLKTISRKGAACAAPQFSPDGKHLAFTSDETGWRSLWVGGRLGQNAVRIKTGEGEIGRPDWVPGLIPARWSANGRILYAVRRQRSRDTLLRITWPGGRVSSLAEEWSEIDFLAVGRGELAFVASGPARPPQLVTFNERSRRSLARATTAAALVDTGNLARAEVISWNTTEDTRVWGVLHRARGKEEKKRPLIVAIHGGPTSEASLGWSAQAQYFATRGWHYLAVNHRGSSGYGRACQEMLRGQWGVFDVRDACTGAIHMIHSGLADPTRVVITGGSAGGYTTLMALAHSPDLWAAGISVYGVADMYELKEGSHRFEVHYEESLIGRLPETGRLWKERSPLTHAEKVKAPVLLFHGTEDKAVPHRQSVDFAEAVRRHGGVAELVSYEGEGHGFQKESTRRDVLEKMERFLTKYVLCRQG